jgi:peptidoglycan/LPS O-acetylase OafA/YrhL
MTTQKIRLQHIDALRGLACAWVLLHHALEHHPVHEGLEHLPLRLLVLLADTGWLGVSLFLVLSGFCLHWPQASVPINKRQTFNSLAFWRKRLKRIIPPYYAAMAFSVALPFMVQLIRPQNEPDLPTIIDVFRHVFLIHNWWPDTFASINGTFWSLALEWQLYVLFPLFLYAFRHQSFKTLAIATLIIGVGWQLKAYAEHGISMRWSEQIATSYHALPARAFEFILGMWAAQVVANRQVHKARHIGWMALALLVPAILFTATTARFAPLLDQAWGVIFAALVIHGTAVLNTRIIPARLLTSMAWLGSISFSVYLIHRATYVHGPFREGSDIMVIGSAFARIAIAVALGYLFYRIFEKPAVAWAQLEAKPETSGPTRPTTD